MQKNKFLVFLILILSITGCQEPSDLIPSVMPTPFVVQSVNGAYEQTSEGTIYIANNKNANMNEFIKATEPSKDIFSSNDLTEQSKYLSNINFPNVKYGQDIQQKSFVNIYDTGGQLAFLIQNNQPDAIFGSNTAYDDLKLNSSPTSETQNVLYAPTVKIPNGCLEIGTDYWRATGETSPTYQYVRLYDFCNNVGWNTGVALPINDSFELNYVRDLGNQVPQYTFEIKGSPTSGWTFYLYNYKNLEWDKYYTSGSGVSTYEGGIGWSLWESHYTLGNCTQLPLIVSSDIFVLKNNVWSNPQSHNSVYGDCFDSNSKNIFTFNNNGWQLTSN